MKVSLSRVFVFVAAVMRMSQLSSEELTMEASVGYTKKYVIASTEDIEPVLKQILNTSTIETEFEECTSNDPNGEANTTNTTNITNITNTNQ
jgi:hypothetical protein